MPGIFLQSLLLALTCQLLPAPQVPVGQDPATWIRVTYGTTIVVRPAGSRFQEDSPTTFARKRKVVRLHGYRSIAELVDASLGFGTSAAGDLADPSD